MDEQPRASYELTVSGGIASLSLIAELTLLSLSSSDVTLRVATYCFAYSLPVMAGAFIGEAKGTRIYDLHFRHADKIFQFVLVSAILAFSAGVTALIFHFGKWVGVVFIAGFVVSLAAEAMVYQFKD